MFHHYVIFPSNVFRYAKGALVPVKPVFTWCFLDPHHFSDHEVLGMCKIRGNLPGGFSAGLEPPEERMLHNLLPKLESYSERGITAKNMGPFVKGAPGLADPVPVSLCLSHVTAYNAPKNFHLLNTRDMHLANFQLSMIIKVAVLSGHPF